MVQSTSPLFSQLAEPMRGEIESKLREYTEFDDDCPDRLRQAIHHSLLAPGKRLRPLLVLMACEACGSDYSQSLPAACAIEMVHTYSLIHDDLPAMDDDDLRRGQPSCHAKFDEATAILAGDALLARSFEVIARDLEPAVAASCCAELGRAAGATALVGGQADDLASEFNSGGLKQLESIHQRKTGALFRASLRLGALVAKAASEQLAALDSYGHKMGLAFQITDDLLDYQGDEQAMGKRTQKDSDRGKLTFPGLLGVEESAGRAKTLIDDACLALSVFKGSARGLDALARYVLERNR